MTDLLSGRFAVVTGSSQGLGFHITDAYLAEGASVAICARNADELAAAEQQLRRHLRDGQRLLSVIADVTKREEVDALFAQVEEEFGTIDILVNNAGIYGPLGLLDEVPWSEWETAITVNLLGSTLAMRAVIPIMKSRGYGKIIQLSGGGGYDTPSVCQRICRLEDGGSAASRNGGRGTSTFWNHGELDRTRCAQHALT